MTKGDFLKCAYCEEEIPPGDMFIHSDVCKKPIPVENREIVNAVDGLKIDLNWLETQSGSFITIRTEDLRRIMRAAKKLKDER